MLRAVVWKELLDLSRDRKTLLSVVLVPLLLFPMLGILSTYLSKQQPIGVAIIDEDSTSTSREFRVYMTKVIEAYTNAYGQTCVIKTNETLEAALKDPNIDVIIVIPKGFSKNLTSITKVAYLMVERRVDTAKAELAESIIMSSIRELSRMYSVARVSILIEKAKVNVKPETILEPIRRVMHTYVSGGKPAPPTVEYKFYTIRILSFALFFVVTPCIMYVTDSLMGEKERKTLEAILATPIRYNTLITGKLLASSLIGALAGLADVCGVLLYFYILSSQSLPIVLTKSIIMIHGVDVAITVFLTSALVTPLIVRSGSARAANIVSSSVLSVAMVIFFSALFIDIPRLPKPAFYALSIVPYTHSILILYYYAKSMILESIEHLAVLVAYAAGLCILAVKLFNPEKMLVTSRK